jgi:hypothetical protein
MDNDVPLWKHEIQEQGPSISYLISIPSLNKCTPQSPRTTDLIQGRSILSTDPTASTKPVYHIPPPPARTYFPCLIKAIGGLRVFGVSIFRRTFSGAEEGKDGRRLFNVGFDIAVYL